MFTFVMNGYEWRIEEVPFHSSVLIDRTGHRRVATTDPDTMTISISQNLDGGFKRRVLIHELGHCALYSFHLLDYIHERIEPRYWIDVEEWACNLLADYGLIIFRTAYSYLGDFAWWEILNQFEKLII